MWHSSSGDSAPSRDREHEKVQGWMEPASEDELWHERCYRRLRCTEMAMNMLRAIMRIWHDRNIISVCAVHNVRTRHKMYPFALAAPYRCDHTAKLVSPSARNQRSELCRCRMPPTVGLRPTTHFGGFPAQQATDVAKQPCEALKSAPPTCLAGNGLQTATATVRRPGEHKDKRASMAGGGGERMATGPANARSHMATTTLAHQRAAEPPRGVRITIFRGRGLRITTIPRPALGMRSFPCLYERRPYNH